MLIQVITASRHAWYSLDSHSNLGSSIMNEKKLSFPGMQVVRCGSRTSSRVRSLPATLLTALIFTISLLACAAAQATSAGHIEVNDRSFDIADDSGILIDDDSVTLQQMHERIGDGGGWRSDSVVLSPDSTLTSGSVSQIRFENNLKGPITATAPLSVLGQPFSVNGNTVLKGFTDVAQLTVGQFLEVSGFVDTDSSLIASRAARDDTSPNPWRITGFLTQFNGASSTATIGGPPGQPISFVGVAPTGCGAGAAIGSYVTALATPIVSFTPGQVIDTVTQLACRSIVPVAAIDDHDSFEGLIQSVADPTNFTIADIAVTVKPGTLFKYGSADDLDAGVRVEVEGTFTSPTALDARRIKFILPSIRFRAPVASADVVPGVSITILGNTVLDSLHDRDEDGIMASGLTDTTQVEVRANLDLAGDLRATRVRSRGNPSDKDYNLQAPAATIARPNLTALGLTVDTSTSSFQDDNHVAITADQFFAAMSVGTLFEIEEAHLDALNNRLFGGVVSLSDDGTAATLLAQTIGPASARVGGTVSTIALDLVFKSGFE